MLIQDRKQNKALSPARYIAGSKCSTGAQEFRQVSELRLILGLVCPNWALSPEPSGANQLPQNSCTSNYEQ